MSETKDTNDKTLSVAPRKPLSLKRTVESGHVKQSFSHGRSKSVVVEKKKKRTISAPGDEAHDDDHDRRGGLSSGELDARRRALEMAKERTEAETRAAEEKAAREREAQQAREEAEHAAAEAAAAVEAATPQVKEEAASAAAAAQNGAAADAPAAEASGAQPATQPAQAATAKPQLPRGGPTIVHRSADAPRTEPRRAVDPAAKRKLEAEQAEPEEEARGGVKKGGKGGAKVAKAPVRGPGEGRERGKLTINNAFDEAQRQRSLASLQRRRERDKRRQAGVQQPRDKVMREVIIPEVITIQELANRMTERAVDVIRLLMGQGAMHKINDAIDADTAELIVREFGHTPKRVAESDVEEGFTGTADADEDQLPRAPVVTIMGHVDHGKTSLLDAIRQTNVAEGEAGGITQHIGAYQVTAPSGQVITFIDTPGHEAFTAMRARGAKVTDIVVLVVAADDGVMPQTVEAINHAKAAGVPMIVAINKMDKPGADPQRVRTDLLQHEVIVESMSGETLEVPVSALKRTGIDRLLEQILLQAELLDFRANPNRTAEGVIIEAKLERGRGPVGTVLVQRGTLKIGDIIVAGTAWGRVRALIDDRGEPVNSAGPSVPVEILGFDSAPEAGDPFAVVENEGRAREITDYRMRKRRQTLGAAGSVRTLEQMMQQLKETRTPGVPARSSRATCRAPSRPSSARCASSAPTRWRLASSTRAWAASPSPISCLAVRPKPS